MKKYINIFASVLFSLVIIFFAYAYVYAAAPVTVDDSNIVYPIKELGNCKDKADCANFCSQSKNMLACVNFAEKQGMLKGEDLRISKVVAEKISKGETPGKCTDEKSCENFCKGKVENIDECISFAEELNILPTGELAQAKNVAKALRGGAKLPGQCQSKDACENYCKDGAHIDECLLFAEAANILSPEDLQQAKAVAPFLKNGETPGGCQSKDACESYCEDDAHADECLSFAEKAGFISKEDADMAKKVGGVGPGGCRGKEECATYCEDQAHADECAKFALDKGLVDEKTAELIRGGIDQMKKALENLPPEIRTDIQNCLNDKIGADKLQRILNKEVSATKNQGESIQSCFAGIEAKIKAMMKNGAPGKGFDAGEGMGAPRPEDIKDLIPPNVPKDIQEKMMEQLKEGTKLPPSPNGGPVPAPAGGQAPQVNCATFANVPSCSYVPENVRDQCEQCKR